MDDGSEGYFQRRYLPLQEEPTTTSRPPSSSSGLLSRMEPLYESQPPMDLDPYNRSHLSRRHQQQQQQRPPYDGGRPPTEPDLRLYLHQQQFRTVLHERDLPAHIEGGPRHGGSDSYREDLRPFLSERTSQRRGVSPPHASPARSPPPRSYDPLYFRGRDPGRNRDDDDHRSMMEEERRRLMRQLEDEDRGRSGTGRRPGRQGMVVYVDVEFEKVQVFSVRFGALWAPRQLCLTLPASEEPTSPASRSDRRSRVATFDLDPREFCGSIEERQEVSDFLTSHRGFDFGRRDDYLLSKSDAATRSLMILEAARAAAGSGDPDVVLRFDDNVSKQTFLSLFNGADGSGASSLLKNVSGTLLRGDPEGIRDLTLQSLSDPSNVPPPSLLLCQDGPERSRGGLSRAEVPAVFVFVDVNYVEYFPETSTFSMSATGNAAQIVQLGAVAVCGCRNNTRLPSSFHHHDLPDGEERHFLASVIPACCTLASPEVSIAGQFSANSKTKLLDLLKMEAVSFKSCSAGGDSTVDIVYQGPRKCVSEREVVEGFCRFLAASSVAGGGPYGGTREVILVPFSSDPFLKVWLSKVKQYRMEDSFFGSVSGLVDFAGISRRLGWLKRDDDPCAFYSLRAVFERVTGQYWPSRGDHLTCMDSSRVMLRLLSHSLPPQDGVWTAVASAMAGRSASLRTSSTYLSCEAVFYGNQRSDFLYRIRKVSHPYMELASTIYRPGNDSHIVYQPPLQAAALSSETLPLDGGDGKGGGDDDDDNPWFAPPSWEANARLSSKDARSAGGRVEGTMSFPPVVDVAGKGSSRSPTSRGRISPFATSPSQMVGDGDKSSGRVRSRSKDGRSRRRSRSRSEGRRGRTRSRSRSKGRRGPRNRSSNGRGGNRSRSKDGSRNRKNSLGSADARSSKIRSRSRSPGRGRNRRSSRSKERNRSHSRSGEKKVAEQKPLRRQRASGSEQKRGLQDSAARIEETGTRGISADQERCKLKDGGGILRITDARQLLSRPGKSGSEKARRLGHDLEAERKDDDRSSCNFCDKAWNAKVYCKSCRAYPVILLDTIKPSGSTTGFFLVMVLLDDSQTKKASNGKKASEWRMMRCFFTNKDNDAPHLVYVYKGKFGLASFPLEKGSMKGTFVGVAQRFWCVKNIRNCSRAKADETLIFNAVSKTTIESGSSALLCCKAKLDNAKGDEKTKKKRSMFCVSGRHVLQVLNDKQRAERLEIVSKLVMAKKNHSTVQIEVKNCSDSKVTVPDEIESLKVRCCWADGIIERKLVGDYKPWEEWISNLSPQSLQGFDLLRRDFVRKLWQRMFGADKVPVAAAKNKRSETVVEGVIVVTSENAGNLDHSSIAADDDNDDDGQLTELEVIEEPIPPKAVVTKARKGVVLKLTDASSLMSAAEVLVEKTCYKCDSVNDNNCKKCQLYSVVLTRWHNGEGSWIATIRNAPHDPYPASFGYIKFRPSMTFLSRSGATGVHMLGQAPYFLIMVGPKTDQRLLYPGREVGVCQVSGLKTDPCNKFRKFCAVFRGSEAIVLIQPGQSKTVYLREVDDDRSAPSFDFRHHRRCLDENHIQYIVSCPLTTPSKYFHLHGGLMQLELKNTGKKSFSVGKNDIILHSKCSSVSGAVQEIMAAAKLEEVAKASQPTAVLTIDGQDCRGLEGRSQRQEPEDTRYVPGYLFPMSPPPPIPPQGEDGPSSTPTVVVVGFSWPKALLKQKQAQETACGGENCHLTTSNLLCGACPQFQILAAQDFTVNSNEAKSVLCRVVEGVDGAEAPKALAFFSAADPAGWNVRVPPQVRPVWRGPGRKDGDRQQLLYVLLTLVGRQDSGEGQGDHSERVVEDTLVAFGQARPEERAERAPVSTDGAVSLRLKEAATVKASGESSWISVETDNQEGALSEPTPQRLALVELDSNRLKATRAVVVSLSAGNVSTLEVQAGCSETEDVCLEPGTIVGKATVLQTVEEPDRDRPGALTWRYGKSGPLQAHGNGKVCAKQGVSVLAQSEATVPCRLTLPMEKADLDRVVRLVVLPLLEGGSSKLGPTVQVGLPEPDGDDGNREDAISCDLKLKIVNNGQALLCKVFNGQVLADASAFVRIPEGAAYRIARLLGKIPSSVAGRSSSCDISIFEMECRPLIPDGWDVVEGSMMEVVEFAPPDGLVAADFGDRKACCSKVFEAPPRGQGVFVMAQLNNEDNKAADNNKGNEVVILGWVRVLLRPVVNESS